MKNESTKSGGICLSALAILAATALAFPSAPAEAASSGSSGVPDSIAASAAQPGVTVAQAVDSSNTRFVIGSKRVRLIGKPENVVRSGPGNDFAIVGVYPTDASFTVIVKTGDWYNVRLSDSQSGWVHSSLCRELDDLSGLEFRPNPKLYTRTGSYVLSAYSGAYAFDRKSNSLVLGGRLGYYVFDRVLAEAGVSWTHVRRAAEIVESLFGLSLEAEDFHMLFYQMNATWEVLPGRQMVPYVSGGVGATIMLGKAEPSVNFGAGTKLFLSKRTAMRWEVRDYRFQTGPDKARVMNNNIEFTLGTERLF